MRCFEDLPRSTQIRYMRRLGQTALTAYELEQARITPLQHFLNTTFRIDIPHPKQRYALRISRAGYQDAATIRSELLWLQAMRFALATTATNILMNVYYSEFYLWNDVVSLKR